jgi:hypothetical protein
MYTMQENTVITEGYFRSHPFEINHIWTFHVYFFFVERHIVFLQG